MKKGDIVKIIATDEELEWEGISEKYFRRDIRYEVDAIGPYSIRIVPVDGRGRLSWHIDKKYAHVVKDKCITCIT